MSTGGCGVWLRFVSKCHVTDKVKSRRHALRHEAASQSSIAINTPTLYCEGQWQALCEESPEAKQRKATQKRMARNLIARQRRLASLSRRRLNANSLQDLGISTMSPVVIRRPTATNSTRTSYDSNVLITPPPPAPPLLLEGDDLYISRDGKSHTVYQLKTQTNNMYNNSFSDLLLEESYDIERARKTMSLIAPALDADTSTEIFSFEIQEINNGVLCGKGTGSMTWESSVAMGLYFAENPHELQGNVIELGSGVGLGGILSRIAKDISSDTNNLSVTLTDVQDDVLNMLQYNTNIAAKASRPIDDSTIKIQKLDWYDYLENCESPKEDVGRYDTIIASDCAYLHSQVYPLSETIYKLLGRDNFQKLHMFAPSNRAVVYDLIDELKDSKDMRVEIEEIEMTKLRIKNEKHNQSHSYPDVSKFLHITARHKTVLEKSTRKEMAKKSIADID